MSDKVVAGAHFSVTKENPNEAWLVVGKLSNQGFEIFDVKKTGTHVMAADLKVYKTLSALGIDCPFSFPEPFLQFMATRKVKKDYANWHEVVEELVFLPFDEFKTIAKDFGKEPKRYTDTADGASAPSPLKKANPNNLHDTYHCMRATASLDPAHFFVSPMQDTIPFGCALMETSPVDTLKYLGFKDLVYHSKDKGDQTMDAVREKLVQDLLKLKEKKALTFKDLPVMSIQKGNAHNFVSSDAAMDALINCYTMAIFAATPGHFADPFSADKMEVLLEGWTYRPR